MLVSRRRALFCGLSGATTPITAVAGEGRQAEIYVRDVGAVGDGVHDDTDAIQEAIDRLKNEFGGPRGGTVLFEPGIYRVTRPIRALKPGMILRGLGGSSYNQLDNYGATLLVTAPDIVALDFDAGTWNSLSGPLIENINLRDVTGTSILIRLRLVNRFTIRNCTFRGAKAGILIDSARDDNEQGSADWGYLEQNIFFDNEVGIDARQSYGFIVIGGDFTQRPHGIGLRVKSLDNSVSAHVRIIGTKFDNGACGVEITSNFSSLMATSFENCDFGVRLSHLSNVAGSGCNNVISGCHFVGRGSNTGIELGSGCVGNKIVACSFQHISAVVTGDLASNTILACDTVELMNGPF